MFVSLVWVLLIGRSFMHLCHACLDETNSFPNESSYERNDDALMRKWDRERPVKALRRS